jgi:biopolymer transport protein ExbD
MENQNPLSPDKPPFVRGIVIGLLIIVLFILLAALYIWGSMLNQPQEIFVPPTNNEPETPRADADIQILGTVSSSDELTAIEADLESTNLDELQKELPLIENDLNSQ